MNHRPDYYVLVGRTPIAVDVTTWATEIEKRKPDNDPWRVARTEINEKCHVSTVFLGLDHNFTREGDPLVFETMIFGGPLDQSMRRYSTYTQAEQGHDEAVAQARIACARVEAIIKNAGAKVISHEEDTSRADAPHHDARNR